MTTETLIICKSCKGLGHVIHEELVSYHKGEYNKTKVKCESCDGFGKIIEVITKEHKKLNEEEINRLSRKFFYY
jgi:Ribonuclease G/E